MTFNKRSAFVTGAASGIGEGIARDLAANGVRVVVADLDEEHGSKVAEGLDNAVFMKLDVADPNEVEIVTARANAEIGPIDIVVNCAGGDIRKPFLETDEAHWDLLLQRNLFGVYRVTKAFLPGLMSRSYGRIVNIASEAGRTGSAGGAVYSGLKGGVIAFSKAIAQESAAFGVTVNTICPGPTDTPPVRRIVASHRAHLDELIGQIPIGRLGTPADVAAAVSFFASDEASFITGQTLSVSGGRSMI